MFSDIFYNFFWFTNNSNISIHTPSYGSQNWVSWLLVIFPPPVLRSEDWTWFGMELIWLQKSSNKLRGIICRPLELNCVKAKNIWERIQSIFRIIANLKEHFPLLFGNCRHFTPKIYPKAKFRETCPRQLEARTAAKRASTKYQTMAVKTYFSVNLGKLTNICKNYFV